MGLGATGDCERGSGVAQWRRGLADLLRRAGAATDIERTVPELHDTVWSPDKRQWIDRTARMDVVTVFPTSLSQWWLDVSIRSVHAERYNDDIAVAGAACRSGEQEKQQRYGAHVRPIVFESQGRLGRRGVLALRELATAASSVGKVSPQIATSWRTQLERLVIAGIADTYVRAVGSSSRVSWANAEQKRERHAAEHEHLA